VARDPDHATRLHRTAEGAALVRARLTEKFHAINSYDGMLGRRR